jgi:two-component system cell cycle sensor histidine kinase/response regulator CckA
VLVVDDEPELRELTTQLLERNSYDVVAAGDGQAALALSRHHEGPIDLLLTDVVMPAMQGTELADAIRLQRPGIVVVYMTGYSKDALADPGMRPVALVEKPFDEETLLEVLRLHLPN